MGDTTKIVEVCNQVFSGTAAGCTAFVPALFLMRVIYGSATGSSDEVRAAIKGTVLYFILINAFPLILQTLLEIPQAYLRSSEVVVPGTPQASMIPSLVHATLETIIGVVYWFATVSHLIFMILMSGMAPVVFLCACLLGIGFGLRMFFGLIVLGSSWPIMWYGLEGFSRWAQTSVTDSFGSVCIDLAVTLLKWLGPITFAYKTLNSPGGMAVSSGAALAVKSFGLSKAAAVGGLTGISAAASVGSAGYNWSKDKMNQRPPSYMDRCAPQGSLASRIGKSLSRAQASKGSTTPAPAGVNASSSIASSTTQSSSSEKDASSNRTSNFLTSGGSSTSQPLIVSSLQTTKLLPSSSGRSSNVVEQRMSMQTHESNQASNPSAPARSSFYRNTGGLAHTLKAVKTQSTEQGDVTT